MFYELIGILIKKLVETEAMADLANLPAVKKINILVKNIQKAKNLNLQQAIKLAWHRLNDNELSQMQQVFNEALKDQRFTKGIRNSLNNIKSFQTGLNMANIKSNMPKAQQETITSTEGTNIDDTAMVNVKVGLNSEWLKFGLFTPIVKLPSDYYGILFIQTKTSPKEYAFPEVSLSQWEAVLLGSAEGHAGSALWREKIIYPKAYGHSFAQPRGKSLMKRTLNPKYQPTSKRAHLRVKNVMSRINKAIS